MFFTLAEITGSDITIGAGILGACWCAIQLLDRFYFGPKNKADDRTVHLQQAKEEQQQSRVCAIDHQAIVNSMNQVNESVAVLRESTQALVEATRASLEISKERHHEVLRELGRRG